MPERSTSSRLRRIVAVLTFTLGLASPLSANAEATPDALTERYRDWTVQCVTPEGDARRCFMAQVLAQDSKRILQVEFTLAGGEPTMVILAPLGLLLTAGARLAIDDNPPRTLPFRTCLPTGCLVPDTPGETVLSSLRRGRSMAVTLVAAQNEEEIALTVSLAGFSAAYDRLIALSAQ